MKNADKTIMVLGFYIKPTLKRPGKGVVYDRHGIAPCLCDYSGGGGNLVPTIIECDEEIETENSEQCGHRPDVLGQH